MSAECIRRGLSCLSGPLSLRRNPGPRRKLPQRRRHAPIARRTSSSEAGRRISTERTRKAIPAFRVAVAPESPVEAAIQLDRPKATERAGNGPDIAIAETDGAHAADVGALIVKIQERIAYLDASIANVNAMQKERERLAVAVAGLSQVLTQLTGQPALAAAASL